jgi:hypothetical protein
MAKVHSFTQSKGIPFKGKYYIGHDTASEPNVQHIEVSGLEPGDEVYLQNEHGEALYPVRPRGNLLDFITEWSRIDPRPIVYGLPTDGEGETPWYISKEARDTLRTGGWPEED